jgi:hypothetical protein
LANLETKVLQAAEQKASETAPTRSLDELLSQIASLSRRVDEVSARPVSAQDARVSELIARIEWVERNSASQRAEAVDEDLGAIRSRLDAIERGMSSGSEMGASLSRGVQTELSMRLSALEQEMRRIEDSVRAPAASGDFEGALRKESDRWTQWARTTIEEIGELRDRVEASGGKKGAGLDAESVETLAVQISSGLNSSEVKALRNQMYFVYLTIGVLWAILLFVLFVK